MDQPLPQFPSHPTCTACALSSTPGVVSIGTPTVFESSLPPSPETPAVLIIGQNPGYEENLANEPFVGSSGLLLRGGYILPSNPRLRVPPSPETEHMPGAYLDGVPLRSVCSIYLSNAVRCWTPGNSTPVWSKHTKHCFHHTIADLLSICRLHRRVSILCISALAVSSVSLLLLGHKKSLSQRDSFKWQGHTVSLRFSTLASRISCTPSPPPAPGLLSELLAADAAANTETYSVSLFSTYHPAYCLRDMNVLHAVESHLHILRNSILGTAPTVTRPTIVPFRGPRP
jgi:hypothetical protein